jgi:UDP-glucose 4-epimerase
MRILLTGASGYLASALIPKVAGEHDVVGLALGGKTSAEEKIGMEECDLTDYGQIKDVFGRNDFDCVVHLAGLVRISPDLVGDSSAKELFEANVIGTLNLLSCATENGANFIFASSMTVYGLPEYLPVDEGHPLKPASIYGLSKKQAEECVEFFSKNTKMKSLVFRFPGLFGGKRRDGAVYNFIRNALQNKPIEIRMGGREVWDILHVEDAADSLARGMDYLAKANRQFEIFNVGYQDITEVRGFAEKIISMAGSSSEIKVTGTGESIPFGLDARKIGGEMDFRPRPLSKRLDEMIAAMRGDLAD